MLCLSLHLVELYVVNLLKHNLSISEHFNGPVEMNLPTQTEICLERNIFSVPDDSVFTGFTLHSSANPVKTESAYKKSRFKRRKAFMIPKEKTPYYYNFSFENLFYADFYFGH